MNLAFPQSFNRYSYAANNPLRYVDPTGLDHCEWIDGGVDDTPSNGGASEQECTGDPNNEGTWVLDDGNGGPLFTMEMESNHPGAEGSGSSGSSIDYYIHALVCSVPGAIGQMAQATGHTVGVGVGGSAAAGLWGIGFGIGGGVQIVSDRKKNIGIAGTFGAIIPFGGAVFGIGAAGGAQVSGSNADDVSKLRGPAVDVSAGGGAGYGGTVDVAAGINEDSNGKGTGPSGVVTTTVTGPFAVGGKGATVMVTRTGVVSTNCSDVW